MVATKQTYSLHNLDQIDIATTLIEALFCKKEKTCVALFYMRHSVMNDDIRV